MTLENFLTYVTQAIFLIVAVISLFSWLRQRDQARLDIALVFLSLAIFIIAQDIQNTFGIESPLLNLILLASLAAHPYFLLRVAHYFRPLSTVVRWLALIGLFAVYVSFLFTNVAPEAERTILVGLVVYFVVVESYAAFLLVKGAFTITGITGNRLRLASLGTTSLALILLAILVLFGLTLAFGELPENGRAVFEIVLQLLYMASAVFYYLGFATPRWLLHAWQLDELHNFLQQSVGRAANDRVSTFDLLAKASTQAVGGVTTAVAYWDVTEQRLQIEVPGDPPLEVEHLENESGGISQAWKEQRARVVSVKNNVGLELVDWAGKIDARSIIAVPIVSPLRQWGLLLTAVRYTPLFVKDDLELLTLLASQSAVSLDYSALIAELRVSNQTLEQHVAARTAELAKANRALLAISECNQELVRADSEDELLKRVCAIIAEKGGYELAWVGYAENDAAQTIRPAAKAGTGTAFFKSLKLSWGDSENGQVPMGIAIRTAQPYVTHIDDASLYRPWQEAALGHGFKACLALPLLDDGKAIGGLGIFSDTTDRFDADEVKLLVELANDLAFGITALRTQAAHAQAEVILREREASFRLLFEGNPVPMWVYDRETWAFLEVNEAAISHYGYSRDEFLSMKITDIRPPDEIKRLQAYLDSHPGELMLAGVWKHRRKNGQLIDAEIVSHNMEYAGRPGALVVVHDVTDQLRLEKELRRSEELLRETNHMAKVGGWELDLKTKAVHWSEETYRIHEVDPSEKPMLDGAINFYAPEARPIITAAIEKASIDGTPWDLVLPFITAKGNRLWVRAQGRAEFENDVCVKLSGVFQDITERKLADDALRESEERFTKAFRASPVSMVITRVRDSRFVDVNDSFLKLFGYERHEVLDHPTSEMNLFSDPDQREKLAKHVQEHGALRNYEVATSTKTGEPLNVIFSTEPVELNSEVFNVTIIFDITARKRAEDKAARSSARLKALAEVSRKLAAVTFDQQAVLDTAVQSISEHIGDLAAIRFLTPDGHWLEHAASYHPDPEALALQRELSMSVPQHVSEGLTAMALRTGEVVMLPEISMEQLKATVKPENWSYLDKVGVRSVMMAPMFDRGEISGVVSTTRDRASKPYTEDDQIFFQDLVDRVAIAITNTRLYAELQLELEGRRRVEEQLRTSATVLERNNRELQDFAYVASHDLQEPLRKIRAFGDRLVAKTEGMDEQGRDYISRMQVAAGRMQTLIEDLLTYSRVTTKAQPFRVANLDQVVRDVVSDLEVRIEQNNAQLELGILPTIEADPVQMRQVFQNLIGNAIKFHKPNEHPVVKVWSETQNGHCLVYVADNGIGFDEKYLDRIFVPFQRLHGRNEYEGTGIGLAVVRKIAERHQGSVTAISKPNEGATFVVTLPMHQTNKEKEEKTRNV